MCTEACGEFSIAYYENSIPSFVDEELDKLYGSRHACRKYFEAYEKIWRIGTYACRKNGHLTAIFLFGRNKRKVEVLNQSIYISSDEIERFAEYIFNKIPNINRIDFRNVIIDALNLGVPFRSLDLHEDVILCAPATVDEYLAKLGKNTRHNIRRYTSRLMHDFPSFTFHIIEEQLQTEAQLRRLLGFSRERMADKNTIGTDEAEFQRIMKMVQSYGFVTEAKINGETCGGLICYKINNNYFFRIVAHDPRYDEYSLGFLLYFMTICESIRRGGRMLNLGWIQYPYKSRLGGVSRKLSSVTIYRSRTQLMLDIQPVIGFKLQQTKKYILSFAVNKGSVTANFTHLLINFFKKIRYQVRLLRSNFL